MSAINVKRLLLKKISPLIRDMASLSEEGFSIKDSDNNIIFEHGDGSRSLEYPIMLERDTIGKVSGGEKASRIASLLNHLVLAEYEKRDLVTDSLEKYKEMTLLCDFSERIAACLDISKITELVIDEIGKIIKFDGISIMLLNRDIAALETVSLKRTVVGSPSRFFWADTSHLNNRHISMKLGEGLAGNVAVSGKGEIVNDVSSDPRFAVGDSPISSIICVPLKIKDKIIGVINVHSESPYSYTAESLKLLTTLSSQVAIAIENARLHEDLRETFLATIETLAETIEKRDPYTAGHTKMVSEYSLAMGEEIGLSEARLDRLRLSSILHDIGKIGIRDDILLKKGKLSDEEVAEMKKHAQYGHEILSPISQLKDILDGGKYHHERYDGQGYPDGLKGEEIPIEARIIAIADSYDAMTSDRPYRQGLSREVAREELIRCSGTQFDPEIVETFLKKFSL